MLALGTTSNRACVRAGYLAIQDALLPIKEHLEPLILEEKAAMLDERELRPWLKAYKPDAIITTDPRVQAMLTDLGCEVPRDLAAATLSVLDGNFDSGVDQNSYETGGVAMRTLAGLIHQNECGIPRYPHNEYMARVADELGLLPIPQLVDESFRRIGVSQRSLCGPLVVFCNESAFPT